VSPTIDRLVHPLAEARAMVVSEIQWQRGGADAVVAAILRHCAQERSTYWSWSMPTWIRIFGATQRAFRGRASGPDGSPGAARSSSRCDRRGVPISPAPVSACRDATGRRRIDGPWTWAKIGACASAA
jgi:hypothetical protein